MENTKEDPTEKFGWVDTTIEEFLGLTPSEKAYVNLKVVLSTELRRRRRDSNLSQSDLAEAIGSSQSRISKMENGDPTVTIDLLVRCLFSLGVTLRELSYLIVSAEDAVLEIDYSLIDLWREIYKLEKLRSEGSVLRFSREFESKIPLLDQDLDSSTTRGVDILAGGVEGESLVRFKSIFNAVNFDRVSHHDELLALFIELVEDLDEDSTVDQLL